MIGTYQVLIAISVCLSLWFVFRLGPPWRSESPVAAWLQAGWAWVAIAFEVVLLFWMFGVRVPLVLGAAVLLAQDVIFAWRLYLLERARWADRAHTSTDRD